MNLRTLFQSELAMNRKKIFAIGVAILFVAGSSAFAQLLPEDPAKGARLFVSKGCVRCHALKGEGGKIGPDFGRDGPR